MQKNEGFRYQYKKTVMGGNDAGSISTASDGCATAVISLPTRYIHSPISVSKKSDVYDRVNLARGVLENLHKLDLDMKVRFLNYYGTSEKTLRGICAVG
ncbi:MAG: hypothetical protein L6V93_10495 [Clostridiales bacterium]|nr:MAG: hypothetical protein L6V93_10495 [Clostridiales bacterium]